MNIILLVIIVAAFFVIAQMAMDFSKYLFSVFLVHQSLVGGIIFMIVGYLLYARLRPHPMESVFLYYKTGLINYEEFSRLFTKAAYDFKSGLPWYHSSLGMTMRLNALRDRIAQEAKTIEAAKEYVINKEMNK